MSTFKKIFYNIIGMVCVVLGIIGRFVPGWPTTIFVIIASIMFSKVNPKMQAWLLKNRFLGPYLDNYYNKRGIAMAYKIRTVWFMWSGMIFSMVMLGSLWVQVLLTFIGACVTLHIFVIKTRQPYENEKMGFLYNIVTVLFVWLFLGGSMALSNNTEATFYIIISAIGVIMSIPVFIYAIIVKRAQKKETIKEVLAKR